MHEKLSKQVCKNSERKHFTAGPSCLLRLTRFFFFLLSLLVSHRAGSHFDISIGKWKKIPFLVLMLMIMSMNKPITGVML